MCVNYFSEKKRAWRILISAGIYSLVGRVIIHNQSLGNCLSKSATWHFHMPSLAEELGLQNIPQYFAACCLFFASGSNGRENYSVSCGWQDLLFPKFAFWLAVLVFLGLVLSEGSLSFIFLSSFFELLFAVRSQPDPKRRKKQIHINYYRLTTYWKSTWLWFPSQETVVLRQKHFLY